MAKYQFSKMPFGKYKGMELTSIINFDPSYLGWVFIKILKTPPYLNQKNEDFLYSSLCSLLSECHKVDIENNLSGDYVLTRDDSTELEGASLREVFIEAPAEFAKLYKTGLNYRYMPSNKFYFSYQIKFIKAITGPISHQGNI